MNQNNLELTQLFKLAVKDIKTDVKIYFIFSKTRGNIE